MRFLPLRFRLVALASLISIVGCSPSVPVEKVYGTYTASYHFGKDVFTLRPDWTFSEQVTLSNGQSAKTDGKWEFDPDASRVTFYGALNPTDGFDNLQKDWREPANGLVSFPVEEIWFRVEMNDTNGEHPYLHN